MAEVNQQNTFSIGEPIFIPVQGMIYETPKVPKLNKIRKSSKKTEDQVWFRDETYLQWVWENDDEFKTPIPEDKWLPEQKEWYDEEVERLLFGSWIMINGVPTYLNNYAYFFHQWFVLLNGRRPDYKETSVEYFRFFELCEKDRFCLGDCGIKGRRVGLSSMSASIKILIALTDTNTQSGIISKTGTDAYEMYLMVKNGVERLPKFITPEIAKVNDSEIHIAKQTPNISKNNRFLTSDKGKNNRVNYLDTSLTAYDGRALRHLTVDEAGKFVKVNVAAYLRKVSETLVVGATIVGKLSLFSTVDKGDAGGDNFKEIWDGSDHINGEKDRYGRTKTKLKRFFIPAYNGFLGYIGKYGESIVETPSPLQVVWLKEHEYFNPVSKQMETCPDPNIGAKEWLQVTRDMLAGDDEALADEMRKNPFEWEEVFEGTNQNCHFNLKELNKQIKVIQDLIGTNRKENGRRMSFKKAPNGSKYPVDDPKGMWYMLKLLEPGQDNKQVRKGSIKCPDNVAFGAAGLDTYAHSRSTVDKGSDACMVVMSRYNYQDPNNSYEPIGMFLGRPDTKEEFHIQIQYGLEYFGIKMLAERSPTDWEDHFVKEMLASPLDHDYKFGYLISTKRYDGSDVYGVPSQQSKNTIEQHLTVMVEYALNNMEKIKFLAILKNMVKFNIKDRTDYDACMAFGYALMALLDSIKQDNKPSGKNLKVLPMGKRTMKLTFKKSA